MFSDEIASKFFNKDESCPDEIIDCENLKTEFFSSLDDLKSKHGCSPCVERHLINKFLEKIKQNLK